MPGPVVNEISPSGVSYVPEMSCLFSSTRSVAQIEAGDRRLLVDRAQGLHEDLDGGEGLRAELGRVLLLLVLVHGAERVVDLALELRAVGLGDEQPVAVALQMGKMSWC
jgi:hypothetical protein